VLAALIAGIAAVILQRLEKPVKPLDKIVCFAQGCDCQERSKLSNCSKCGRWFCPNHANKHSPRLCSNCTLNTVDYLRIRTSQEIRKDVKDYSIQLAGLALAGLAIIFSIPHSTPNSTLVASFSFAIFLFFLTYIMLSYFESYGSFIIEQILFVAGIEVLVVGVIDFAYPTLDWFPIMGVNVGPALMGVGITAAFMLALILVMQIRDTLSDLRESRIK
jgi:hypothetical protein